MNIMKNIRLLVLVMLGFTQVSGTAEDYSKMSVHELNAAFVVAVEKGSYDEVQMLVQAGADINTSISYTETFVDCDWEVKSTVLIYAVRLNDSHMVKMLLKKVLLKVEKKELNEALDVAIKKGYLDVVEELIKGGADVNYVDERGDTPLIIAVKQARPTIEFSPQAQERARSRWSERREIIKTLLKAGAKVNHVNKNGRTALMEAVREHDLNIVQSLLQVPEMTTGSYFGFGTKPINYADQDGNTALILAVKSVCYLYIDNQEYNICKNSQKIIEELLKTPGIDAHHVNKNGDTAIKLLQELDQKMK